MTLGTDTITTLKAHANLDYFYGPWLNKQEALKIPENLRKIGLTVGILDDALGVVEYLWKKGIKDKDLIEKNKSNLVITLINPSNGVLTTDTNTNVVIRLEGENTPASIEVFSKTSLDGTYSTTNYTHRGQIGKDVDILIDLGLDQNPSPRTVYYAIRVTDTLGNVARTTDDKDMVEFVVNYKEILVSIAGTSEIYDVKVKSLTNIENKNFIFNVSKINAVKIEAINILIGDNTYKTIPQSDFDNDSHLIVLDNLLDIYKGSTVTIQINYTLNGESRNPFIFTVFQILGNNVFTNALIEYPSTAYQNTNFDIKLYYEAENELNYPITISSVAPKDQREDNRGIVYSSTYLAYTTNTITLSVDLSNPLNKTKETQTYYIYVNNNYSSALTSFSIDIYPYSQDRFIPETGSNIWNYYDNIDSVSGISTEVNNGVLSFIMDMECFIPYSEDVTETLFNYLNIEIKTDYIRFGDKYYPTPILEQTSLGFAYNVREGSYVYNAMFINGVLCFKVPVVNPTKVANPGTIINKLSIYDFNFYYNSGNVMPAVSSTSTTVDYSRPHIITQNYLSRHSDANTTLPLFQIEAISYDSEDANVEVNGQKVNIYDKRGIYPGRFGNIGDEKYDDRASNIEIIKNNVASYNVLMKLTTNLKKTLQKKIGVICKWQFGGQSGLVEVHTQGTSTLDYSLPNFKFTFLDNEGNKLGKKLVPNEVNGDYFEETTLTAKADYMDSSHLNNTPTAMLYNRFIQSPVFHSDGNDYRSPSALINGLDAIEGFPIIMEIKDIDELENLSDRYVNYGSFMLNVDKTGSSLKFKIPAKEDTCISFEGTSNDDNSGLSSRFIIPQNLINDFSIVSNLLNSNEAIENWYCNNNYSSDGVYKINYTKVTNNVNGATVTTLLYDTNSTKNNYYSSVIKVLDYLAEGLEYRYPDEDIISQKDNSDKVTGAYTLMPFSHFKRLFKMFYWVANSASLTEQDYKTQFNEVFNFYYCALYFIQLMVFGQTDNLGKNCMFDQWEEDGLWYPRPYDLDSLVGLNNNGIDIIPPFVEIRPNFSLNYSLVQSNGETIYNNYKQGILDSSNEYYQILQDNPDLTLQQFLTNYIFSDNYLRNDSKLYYEGNEVNRYGYSSPTTAFWTNFFNRFKPEIQNLYKELRDLKVNENLQVDEDENNNIYLLYSPESIVNFVKNHVTDKLGILQYNLDFRYKYLPITADSEQFALGNRYYKYKDWITKRFSFCDVYFQYERYTTNVKNGSVEMHFNFPQYFIQRLALDNSSTQYKFYDGTHPISLAVEGAAVNNDLYFSPKNIISGAIYNIFNSCNPKIKLNNLISLSANATFFNIADISENTYMQNLTLTGINSEYSNMVPKNVQVLTINNSSKMNNLDKLLELRQLTITNCDNLVLNVIQCPKLLTLIVRNCTYLRLTIQGLTNLESLDIILSTFSRLDINGCNFPLLNLNSSTLESLAFSGDESNIGIVDLRNANIKTLTDISALVTDSLLMNNTIIPGIVCALSKPKEFKYLSLNNSSLAYWRNQTEDTTKNVFDGSLFTNLSNVKAPLDAALLTNLNSNATRFKLLNCLYIEEITNLNLTKGTSTEAANYLCANCFALKTVSNSTINWSGDHMFYDCVNLENISTTTITLVDNSARYMFTGCNKLKYSYIEEILKKNTNVTDFYYFLEGKTFNEDTIILLSHYSNATDMGFAFSSNNWIPGLNVLNRNTSTAYKVTFQGTLSEDLTSADTTFSNNTTNCTYEFLNWDTLISNCSDLASCRRMFYGNDFEATNNYLKSNKNIDYILTSTFFPNNKVTNVMSTFERTKNLTIDPEFKFPSSIVEASRVFAGSTIKGSDSIDIQNFFLNCNSLTNLVYGFNSCPWIKLEVPLKVNISSNTIYNVYGIFSSCNTTLNYGFTGNWKSEYNNQVIVADSTIITYGNTLGVYQGNTVIIENDTLGLATSDGGNNRAFTKLFEGATLQLKFDITDSSFNERVLTLQIGRATDIRRICLNTKIKEDTLDSTIKLYIEPKFTSYASTTNATQAFMNCGVLKISEESNYVFVLPNTLQQASQMFASSSVNVFPDLHNTRLINASSMFNNCRSLYSFYNPMKDLGIEDYSVYEDFKELENLQFVLPSTLTNVDYMFQNCYNLQGGIPINFIKWDNNLKSLLGMFDGTAILMLGNNESSYALNISEMFPQVVNVSRLFRYNWLPNSNNYKWQLLDSECFKNCTNISYLFEHNPFNSGTRNSAMASLPSTLYLTAATNMVCAFHHVTLGNTTIPLENNKYIDSVIGMFATGSLNTVNLDNTSVLNAALSIYNSINSNYRASVTRFEGFVLGYNKPSDGLTLLDSIYYQTVNNLTNSMINLYHTFEMLA